MFCLTPTSLRIAKLKDVLYYNKEQKPLIRLITDCIEVNQNEAADE